MRRKPEIRVKIVGMNPSSPIKVPSYVAPEEVALLLESILRRTTPIDTGNARAGWEIDLMKNGNIRLTNNVDYVQYLEEGHSKQAPRGFVLQAMDQARQRMYRKSPYRRKQRTQRKR